MFVEFIGKRHKIMKEVLIVGSGGREHCIGRKIFQDYPDVQLTFAPGNAGTGALGENIPFAADDVKEITEWAMEHRPDLVIIGPEGPLDRGLADRLREKNIRVFGPSQGAAQIEASKVYAKGFMERHGIPTARWAAFTDFPQAVAHLKEVDYPVVIKASGLAAGKGVFLPDSTEKAEAVLQGMMIDRAFDDAGSEVVIEERLTGDEVSLLAFTDGVTVQPMPPAQDHKRL